LQSNEARPIPRGFLPDIQVTPTITSLTVPCQRQQIPKKLSINISLGHLFFVSQASANLSAAATFPANP
jgi:hypothetical protein